MEVTLRIEDVITATTEKEEGKENVTADQSKFRKKLQSI